MHPHPNPGSDPELEGQWEPIEYRFHHLPVHVALLHTGKVLAFGGSCNDPECLHQPYPSELWDPEAGDITVIDQALDGDVFCAGHCFLEDGRLLAAGGTFKYNKDLPKPLNKTPLSKLLIPFAGLEQTYLFDPVRETWTRGPDMRAGRWYPTLVTLGDGRALAIAGFTKHCPWFFQNRVETFSPGAGWSKLAGAHRWLPLYPRLHVVPNASGGSVFYSGSYNTHYVYPFQLKRFPTLLLDIERGRWKKVGFPKEKKRREGTSVLLPLRPPDYSARVLLVGGGTDPKNPQATASAEIIDFSDPKPEWHPICPMKNPRFFTYATLLPTGEVLVLGGQRAATAHEHAHDTRKGSVEELGIRDCDAVLEPELFDPRTNQWRPLPHMVCDRLYHANAILLPDGRVIAVGSNPDRGQDELRIEIYQPPYLFRGERPEISECSGDVTRGSELRISSPHAREIDEVCLIRASATTHCLDTDQRYVGLQFRSEGDDVVWARVPEDPNISPPGYYLLFVLRRQVPSVGRFVRVVGKTRELDIHTTLRSRAGSSTGPASIHGGGGHRHSG
ncbi:MAG: DUF1929 domain-containing protein [Actinobacteria bacterium]|nr:DUF1929 domain-containing protein [Actinomycetota bacterium]